MKILKVTFETTRQFLQSTLLGTEEFEAIKKRNVANLFAKEMIKEDLIKIELDKIRPATPERPIDTYMAECFIQTIEERDQMINEFRLLTTLIRREVKFDSIIFNQLDKLKEILK